jgi:hypothetical protein
MTPAASPAFQIREGALGQAGAGVKPDRACQRFAKM